MHSCIRTHISIDSQYAAAILKNKKDVRRESWSLVVSRSIYNCVRTLTASEKLCLRVPFFGEKPRVTLVFGPTGFHFLP